MTAINTSAIIDKTVKMTNQVPNRREFEIEFFDDTKGIYETLATRHIMIEHLARNINWFWWLSRGVFDNENDESISMVRIRSALDLLAHAIDKYLLDIDESKKVLQQLEGVKTGETE